MEEQYEEPETDAVPREDATGPRVIDEAEKRLVAKLTKRVRDDRAKHKEAFKRMRHDAYIARCGAEQGYPADSYKVNITGRHINQKVAALYAKNPKAVARRRETLDFQVWDETEQTLMQALAAVAQAQMATFDPASAPAMDPVMNPAADPMVQQAMAMVMDYEQGMRRRQMLEKIGRTLEILFAYYTNEQVPLDFKTQMKRLVRAACTTGVGYVKLGFQREYEANAGVRERLADFRTQLQKIEQMQGELAEGNDPEQESKTRELEIAIQALQEQEFVLIREGLVFDFPEPTAVIPDKMTRSLQGFIGARWVTVEHLYTPDEVKRQFGVDLGKDYKAYSDDGTYRDIEEPEFDFGSVEEGEKQAGDMVCVWEHYDRESGVMYLMCDGYRGFLREPGAPEVYVEDFWPVYALTFNEVTDPSCLFPPSDVTLMFDMQRAYNATRQGQREHRKAARPRFATAKGVLDDEDKMKLASAAPFEVVDLAVPAELNIAQALQPIPVPGVDPNLYETGTIFTDVQLTVGAQEAQFGAVAKATATESSIAEGSRIASVDSNVDDLDAFLTKIARAAGQILLRELSAETVTKIAGPGAVWPQMTLDQIVEELVLEIEAGSSGKPNQAQEIRNWREMLPFLVQMPNINPTWLARETLKRLDDRMDLTEAITENIPAIVAQNRLATMGPGGAPPPAPGAAPEDQGGAGADNTERPADQPGGSDAPMGNNQQAIM